MWWWQTAPSRLHVLHTQTPAPSYLRLFAAPCKLCYFCFCYWVNCWLFPLTFNAVTVSEKCSCGWLQHTITGIFFSCSMYNQSFLGADTYYTIQGMLSNHFVCIMLIILLFIFLAIYRSIHNLLKVNIMSHICKWWKETMFTKVFVYVNIYILYNLKKTLHY